MSNIKILVASNDRFYAKDLIAALAEQGADVIHTDTPEKAQNIINQGGISLLIANYRLGTYEQESYKGGLGEYAVAELVKNLNIPVVILGQNFFERLINIVIELGILNQDQKSMALHDVSAQEAAFAKAKERNIYIFPRASFVTQWHTLDELRPILEQISLPQQGQPAARKIVPLQP